MDSFLSATRVLAQATDTAEALSNAGTGILVSLMSVVVFSAIGVVVFAICFVAILKVTPFSVRKEIEDDQNTALAIIIGSILIGISIIIAAAVHG